MTDTLARPDRLRSGVDGRMETENAIVGMLQPLAERGVSIVFEAPKPLFRSPPPGHQSPVRAPLEKIALLGFH